MSKISRKTLKSSKSDIFYLLRILLKYLPRTFFSSAKFSEVFALCVFYPQALSEKRPPICTADSGIARHSAAGIIFVRFHRLEGP